MKEKIILPSLHRNPESLNDLISGATASKSSASNKIKYKILKVNKSVGKREESVKYASPHPHILLSKI